MLGAFSTTFAIAHAAIASHPQGRTAERAAWRLRAAVARAGGSSGACIQYAQGTIEVGPGGLTSPRTYTASGTANNFACKMPDPSIHSATEAWSETGTFTCAPLRATGSGTDTFTWSNGRESFQTYTHTSVGGYDETNGMITGGEFKGLRVQYRGVATVDSRSIASVIARGAQICAFGQPGSALLFYIGVGRFMALAADAR